MVVFKISANREHPLPASPCLRRGRGRGKSSRLKPLLQESGGARSEPQVFDRLAVAADQAQGLDADLDVALDVLGAHLLVRGFRTEGSRVGKEGVSTCRSRWAPFH